MNSQVFNEHLQPIGDQQSLSSLASEQLRLMISNRVIEPGDQLPSEPELAQQLNISRVTLREAIKTLVLEGLLIRKRGVGTFVAANMEIENPLNRNTSVTEFIRSKGAVPNTKDMEITIQQATAYIARMLRIDENDPIISIQRTRTANERPVIFSKEHLSLSYLKEKCEEEDIAGYVRENLTKNQSLNEVLKNAFNVRIDHAFAKISALSADEYIADKLILEPGDCLIRLEQVDFDPQDNPIMLSNEYYPGQSSFTVYRSS